MNYEIIYRKCPIIIIGPSDRWQSAHTYMNVLLDLDRGIVSPSTDGREQPNV